MERNERKNGGEVNEKEGEGGKRKRKEEEEGK